MPESIATKSMHVPTPAHRALRRLQLQIEEQTGETISLGDLVGAAIILGLERPLEQIIAQAKQNTQPTISPGLLRDGT